MIDHNGRDVFKPEFYDLIPIFGVFSYPVRSCYRVFAAEELGAEYSDLLSIGSIPLYQTGLIMLINECLNKF